MPVPRAGDRVAGCLCVSENVCGTLCWDTGRGHVRPGGMQKVPCATPAVSDSYGVFIMTSLCDFAEPSVRQLSHSASTSLVSPAVSLWFATACVFSVYSNDPDLLGKGMR